MSDTNSSVQLPGSAGLAAPAEPTSCPCCGRQLSGPSEHHSHEPRLGDLLGELESGRQPPLTWHQRLSTCILPDLIWEVCDLELDEPLTAVAVRDMGERIQQSSGLRIDQVDALSLRDAAALLDGCFRGEIRVALAAALAHAR